jgi:hypothetical protein
MRQKDKDDKNTDRDNDSKSMAGDVVEFKKRVIGQFQKRMQRAMTMNRDFTAGESDEISSVQDKETRRSSNQSMETFSAFIQKKLLMVQKDKVKK